MTMVNLSNVTHTCVWATNNEQVCSIVSLVVEIGIDASIGVESLLLSHNNYKIHTLKYQYKYTKYKINI